MPMGKALFVLKPEVVEEQSLLARACCGKIRVILMLFRTSSSSTSGIAYFAPPPAQGGHLSRWSSMAISGAGPGSAIQDLARVGVAGQQPRQWPAGSSTVAESPTRCRSGRKGLADSAKGTASTDPRAWIPPMRGFHPRSPGFRPCKHARARPHSWSAGQGFRAWLTEYAAGLRALTAFLLGGRVVSPVRSSTRIDQGPSPRPVPRKVALDICCQRLERRDIKGMEPVARGLVRKI